MRRIVLAIALALVGILGGSGVAVADIDIKRADELFAQGLALRDTDFDRSCEKFRESLKWNPQAIGTLLNVALCDEKQGRIASAVAKFSEARDRAKEQQLPEHIAAAQAHIEKLVPELSYLTIELTEPPGPDTTIVIDEQVVPLTKLSGKVIDKLPVDAGERVVVVSAPGRLPFTKTILVDKRATQTIVVPMLAKSVTVKKVVKSSRRTIGKITLASGVGVAGIGLVIGLVAKSRYDEPFESGACEVGTNRCTEAGKETTDRARTAGNVGTVVTIAGIGGAVVGTVLWLTGPRDVVEPARVGTRLVPHVAPDSIGVAAIGRF